MMWRRVAESVEAIEGYSTNTKTDITSRPGSPLNTKQNQRFGSKMFPPFQQAENVKQEVKMSPQFKPTQKLRGKSSEPVQSFIYDPNKQNMQFSPQKAPTPAKKKENTKKRQEGQVRFS